MYTLHTYMYNVYEALINYHIQYNTTKYLYCVLTKTSLVRERVMLHS